MASVKNLKKDVNYLTDEVVGTCLLHQYANKEENQQKVDQLIDEILESREDLINKLNHPEDRPEGKSIKAWYNEQFDAFIEKVNATFEALGEIGE
ncbi:MAG: hypothetical protein R6U64_04565 [Bacteroidales bacterium]